ncbi:Fe-S cluster assembly ATPase SufC [Treponema peruense]|uniref:Fe-S cluster assembly ATPase SufC n=1 Tax=Treponema peruense TaxID=2787628 RepID=A0A7T3V448_9SPIR|nr:Fe-S cluster assembly ATPase SufC [Treponema peruense]QQA00207.1 Fe-S cluster assembly ATPase SufC [Treponema peruense]
MADKLLQIQKLSAGIGDKTILHDVSLEINPGEIHVLMGPNGAGKSTLGYTLMGSPEYSVSGGHIFFDGEDITSYSADKRAKAGIFLSFQEPLEVPGISLESFIRSSMQQVSGQKIKLFSFQKELEKAMDILNMNHSYAGRDLNVGFSGGEKKKSEILQLLMLKPKLAILDETDSGLDVDAVRTVSKGIEEYQKSVGGSLLIITHSTRILESLHVDRTHVMVKGHLVHSGDGTLVNEINENGFDKFIPAEIKDAERRERLAAAAKAAMESVKANAANGGL